MMAKLSLNKWSIWSISSFIVPRMMAGSAHSCRTCRSRACVLGPRIWNLRSSQQIFLSLSLWLWFTYHLHSNQWWSRFALFVFSLLLFLLLFLFLPSCVCARTQTVDQVWEIRPSTQNYGEKNKMKKKQTKSTTKTLTKNEKFGGKNVTDNEANASHPQYI